MNLTSHFRRSCTHYTALGGVALGLLGGCSGEKIVANVDGSPIKESEFYGRAVRMTAAGMPQSMDAGTAALVTLIRERMTAQLAKEKGSVPDPALVDSFAQFQLKTNPTYQNLIAKGVLTLDDLKNNSRYALQEFGIGTEGAKTDAKKIEDEYNTLKKQPAVVPDPQTPGQQQRNFVKMPETYTVRFLSATSLDMAKQALVQLKSTGNFKQVARMVSDPTTAQTAGEPLPFVRDALKLQAPKLEEALSKLSDGQFVSEPVLVPTTDPQNPTVVRNNYIVAQLVKREKEYTFSLEEMRAALELRIVERETPTWRTHKDQEMAKFTSKMLEEKRIQISLKQYEGVIENFIRPMAETFSSSAPGGTLSGGGATPPTGGATPPTGGATPPTGGGTPPPTGR